MTFERSEPGSPRDGAPIPVAAEASGPIEPPAPSDSGSAIPCAACGYDLRGADVTRCPECGTPIAEALPLDSRLQRILRRARLQATPETALRFPKVRRIPRSVGTTGGMGEIRRIVGRYSMWGSLVIVTLAILVLLVSSLIRMANALR